ncbi:MAG: helix-turn-helix transcriptional regulator [Ilumatobacter sp.]|uniref:helix-turn-helix domain-containing protein n=1 Tax=Ilumatobacter sp. TaxID=1967498 RepID=UPI003C796AB7
MSQRIPIRTGNDLGQAIVEARRSLDLSATEVAQRTGLSPQYLSKIESGRTTRVLEHQLRILRRLGARVIVEFPDDER